jgi:hypothetical protein
LATRASRPRTSCREEVSLGFDNQASAQTVSQLLAEQYVDAAETLAATAVADLDGLLPCDPAVVGTDDCAAEFIESFGKRAYRRPLTADEVSRLHAVFAAGLAGADFETGIRLVLTAMLASPHFLFRVELETDEIVGSGVVPLGPYELATRLSYLFTGSMPDEELLLAADEDRLGTPNEILAQGLRLLQHPFAREAVANFASQWLSLTQIESLYKDVSVYPGYYDELRPLWRRETEAFVTDVVFDGDGDLASLLAAPYTMVNAELAEFYGVTPGPQTDEFERIDLDPSRGAGFLSHASVLATNAYTYRSSPVHRGKFVREQLLCQILPPPPPDAVVEPPQIDPSATTKEQFAQHSEDPSCSGCHQLMDPIGFGFEHYDGIGSYRDVDNGLPVDATGEVLSTWDVDGPFDGVRALGDRLADSEQVRDCFVRQWYRFAHGRSETAEDACDLAGVATAFAGSGDQVQELLLALVQSQSFRHRRALEPGE